MYVGFCCIVFSFVFSVLRIEDGEQLNQADIDGLSLADEVPPIGTHVGYAGFPLGIQLMGANHTPTYCEGTVSAGVHIDGSRREIQISGAVVGGYSGAPIVAVDNPTRVIGIVSNSPSNDAQNANIFRGISIEHINAIAHLAIS